MRLALLKQIFAGLGAVLVGLLVTTGAQASTFQVSLGYDLFETAPDTSFMGVPFQGVPLGTFNFGGTIGTKNVGTTDTIVQRVQPASFTTPLPQTATIPIEMLSLQLQSSVPANFGLGVGTYFITLQSARGGPASVGTMAITDAVEPPPAAPQGTFNSFFDVFFDVRLGSLTGPIALSSDLVLSSNGVLWKHDPTAGAIQIPGVNIDLNGIDTTTDFWPITPFQEGHPGVAIHVVKDPHDGTTVPEVCSTLWLLLSAAVGLGVLKRRTQ